FAVVRLTPSGGLDGSFNNATSRSLVDFADAGGQANDSAYAMARQPTTGDLILVGGSTAGPHGGLAIAALTSGGQLDPAFDGDGRQLGHYESTWVSAAAAATTPDGKVLVGGLAMFDNRRAIAIARYTAAGVLDPSFGVDGRVLPP